MNPAFSILFLLFSIVYVESQDQPESGEEGPQPPREPVGDMLPSACGCRVGFSAYMSSNSARAQSLTMVDGKTLVFDLTTANTGHYNTGTGRFRAPSRGTYAFTWTLCVDSRYTDGGAFRYGEYGSVLMNGRGICGYLHADTERKYDDACSTAFVICRVYANEEVYVRNDYSHQGKLLSKDGQTRTTFSGWKLFD